MTNHETSRALWKKALHIRMKDASAAMETGDFNLCIRRAQEAVELALKSALRFLGLDYPKHHDVAGLFCQACGNKGIAIAGDALERIRAVSSELSGMRGPAFYLEEVYSRDQAVKALENADFVLDTIKKLESLEEMMSLKKRVLTLAAIILAGAAHQALAAPNLLTYQGRLKEGGALVTGARNVEIYLCDSPSGGSCYSTGAQGVSVTNGIFRSTFTLPGFVLNNLASITWYLRIDVDTIPPTTPVQLAPREQLTSSAYALEAAAVLPGNIKAGTLGTGVIVGAGQLGSGVLGSGVLLPVAQLGTGVLGTGVLLPTNQLQAGTLGTGVLLPASQIQAGSVGSGVQVPAGQVAAGTVGTGVLVPAGQVGAGTLGAGVFLAAGQLGSGVLGTGVLLPTNQLQAGTLGTGVLLPTNQLQAGTLGTGVLLSANQVSAGILATGVLGGVPPSLLTGGVLPSGVNLNARTLISGPPQNPGNLSGTGCGSGPSIAGNDGVGHVTIGPSASGATCTLNFTLSWPGTPVCFTNPVAGVQAIRAMNATAASVDFVIITPANWSAGNEFDYMCIGR